MSAATTATVTNTSVRTEKPASSKPLPSPHAGNTLSATITSFHAPISSHNLTLLTDKFYGLSINTEISAEEQRILDAIERIKSNPQVFFSLAEDLRLNGRVSAAAFEAGIDLW